MDSEEVTNTTELHSLSTENYSTTYESIPVQQYETIEIQPTGTKYKMTFMHKGKIIKNTCFIF